MIIRILRPSLRLALVALLALVLASCLTREWHYEPVAKVVPQGTHRTRSYQVEFLLRDGTLVIGRIAAIQYPDVLVVSGESHSETVELEGVTTIERATALPPASPSWEPLPMESANDSELSVVRCVLADGRVVEGIVESARDDRLRLRVADGTVFRVAAEDIVRARVEEYSENERRAVKITLIVAVCVVGAVAVLWLLAVLVLLFFPPIFSCPYIYLETPDGGLEIVGEAFSGSALRASQRTDMLHLPDVREGTVRLVVANEMDETEYIDQVALVLVDHVEGARALPTPESRMILVGQQIPPLSVVDLEGRDVSDQLGKGDDIAWATDMEAVTRTSPAPGREGLVATFPGTLQGPHVLELKVANTPWQEIVSSRMWSSFGEQLEKTQQWGADPSRRDMIDAWNRRAGISLVIEVPTEGGWREVATIPNIGWIGHRRLAIPIPESDGPPVARISGGLGFWMVREIAISPVVDSEPAATRITPATATSDGSPVDSVLARIDGDYVILPERGASLDLAFDLPGNPTGARDVFFEIDGYYSVHPIPGSFHAHLLRGLQRHPERLAAYSAALYGGLRETLDEGIQVADER